MATTSELPETTGHRAKQVMEGPLASEVYIPRVMPSIINTRDMTTTFIASIFLASAVTTAITGGPAALTYLLITCLLFFIPSIVAIAQLGTTFPYAGALYHWTCKTLGGSWGFFVGFCSWLPGATLVTTFAGLFTYYLRELYPDTLAAPWVQGVAICSLLAFTAIVSIQRLRTVQNIVNILICLLLLALFLVNLSGVVWLLRGNHAVIDLSQWTNWRIKPDNFTLFGLAMYAYLGAAGPSLMAGETVGHRPIRRHLIWGALFIFITYTTCTLSVLVVQGRAAAGNPFALVTVVDMALGRFAGNTALVCLMGSFIAAILVYNQMYARLLMVMGIDRYLPIFLGRLNRQRAPANAIFTQTVISVLFVVFAFIILPAIIHLASPTDLANGIYSVACAAAVIVWLVSYAFLFINLASYSMRNRLSSRQWLIVPAPILVICIVVGLLGCTGGIVAILFYAWIPRIGNQQWWYIVGGLALIVLIITSSASALAHNEALLRRQMEK